ncbi:ATP-binding protein [Streptomyces sp. NPDC058762]|uniref:ATP-binding protein n=1 Tax=Streptomyces sp. NPDC058762 TaxID=3346629 RepID=UPI0036A9DDF4
MDHLTRINLDHWHDAIAAHGYTPEQINDITGDPYDQWTVARKEITHADQHVPFIYQHALPDHDDVRAWADSLTAASRKQSAGRITTSVGRHRSLLLLGPTGTGKTHQAYGALRYLAPTGINWRWTATSSADLYAALRPRAGVDSETEFRRFAHARLLLLDDLGAAKNSEWTEEINFRLINHRYENQLPTILTSNVLPKELLDRVGDRVSSRLIEMCDRIVIKGTDRRKQAAA